MCQHNQNGYTPFREINYVYNIRSYVSRYLKTCVTVTHQVTKDAVKMIAVYMWWKVIMYGIVTQVENKNGQFNGLKRFQR